MLALVDTYEMNEEYYKMYGLELDYAKLRAMFSDAIWMAFASMKTTFAMKLSRMGYRIIDVPPEHININIAYMLGQTTENDIVVCSPVTQLIPVYRRMTDCHITVVCAENNIKIGMHVNKQVVLTKEHCVER